MRLLALLAALLFAPAALGQTWPTKPVRIVVAFPPGGSTDLAARALGDRLATVLGGPVVIENRPGASGNIGAEAVARAAPDGYTLLMAATSFATAPAFFENLSWDPLKDFAPVSLVAMQPVVIVVNPALPARDVRELVAYSKANPGKLAMASPGAATLVRLTGEMFKQAAGLDWLTVNYKGGPPAVADLLGGHAQVMFAIVSDVLPHVQAGKLRALAVTSAQRSAIVPELPTVRETGELDFDSATWPALMAPAATPPAVIQRLNAETVKIMRAPR
jgi:tripartite-type tricarboxylate transporter receptor subunit TctC